MDLLGRWSPTFSGKASKARPSTRNGQRALRFAGVRAVAVFGLLSIAGCGTPFDPDCWERTEPGTGNVDYLIPYNFLCELPEREPRERKVYYGKYDKSRHPTPQSDNSDDEDGE